ncbi:DnaA regulatory inactivator Hda [Dokdonella sp.]|uniref:DnaA regulatory inactivator Hda n=1 Tax=Dokdonella sp. TaxID=2291710 RepID=UPI001B2C9EFD|nr:DnaA regulatory inactivator Hda [Dokdonella sp.]MBO9663235.1 DnaA regulatory inactivator Hda [Dokdonella sp.]
MTDQLPLALRWPAHQRFDSFVAGANAAAVELLRAIAQGGEESWAYLAGASGSGRTHLLVAACACANAAGRSAQYLSLAALRTRRAEAIRGFGGSDLLAIDDLDAIAGEREAEHALFDLYNRCRAERASLLFAATAPAAQLGIGLPDLVSRLSACTQLALKPLDESARRDLLRDRALARGIELDDAALDWLFARGRRDLASLLAALDRIDRASLASQRRVTVPFLRSLLGKALDADEKGV